MKVKKIKMTVILAAVCISSINIGFAASKVCDDDGVMNICLNLKNSEISKKELQSITRTLRNEIPFYDEGEATVNCRLSTDRSLCDMSWRAFELCGEMTFELDSKNTVQNINELWVKECNP